MRSIIFRCTYCLISILAVSAAVSSQAKDTDNIVRVYNWEDYIAEDTLEKFTQKTGIKVIYETFESDQDVEKLLSEGKTNYDVVVPSLHFIGESIWADRPFFKPINKLLVPNLKYLDPAMMRVIGQKDPNNSIGVPYLWGTVGIGYNEAMVKKVLGSDAPVDSWSLIFNVKNLKKLSRCGVAFIDSPSEVLPLLMMHNGIKPYGLRSREYQKLAAPLIKQLSPYIRYFNSFDYIEDLANGKICVALGWSGDILQAMDIAEEEKTGVELAYNIPKQGSALWVDMLIIPRNAENPDNAHAFINFLLEPKIMAEISNYVWYANVNNASREFMEQDILDDESIYPGSKLMRKLFLLTVSSPILIRKQNAIWADMKRK
ncbi:MAG: extracellular solute-binding protein [Pseudomonadales bacterium]|nr:extracellular solute-binding protein [Pseudomonadales bacterium]